MKGPEDIQSKKHIIIVLLIYIICFYATWSVFEMYLKGQIDNLVLNECVAQLIKSGIIKVGVWTVPAFLLLRYFDGCGYLKLQEMFTNRIVWRPVILLLTGFTLYIAGISFYKYGTLGISCEFGIEQIIVVAFVGITEEMVFRGLLLNLMYDENRRWLSVIINAVLFLAIHFPRWINEGVFLSNITQFSFVGVIFLSIVFSQYFIKQKNIIPSIILHMYWDLLIFMFM